MHLIPQVAKASVPSKVVVPVLLIKCLINFPFFVGNLCLSLFWYTILCVLSMFAIILKGKTEQVDLLLLSHGFLVVVNVIWLFLKEPWAGLQCAIVVFPDHAHLLFEIRKQS